MTESAELLFDQKYANFVIRHRWAIIFMSILLVAFVGSGARFLSFSSNYKVMFDPGNPELMAFEKLQNTYSKSDNIFILVDPKNENVFEPEILQAITELTDEAWQIVYSSRVDSITNFQHTYSIEDDLIVEDLISDPLNMTPEAIARARDIAVNEPLIVNRLIAPDGKVTAVNITVNLPPDNEIAVREVSQASRELVNRMEEKYPDLSFAITGMAALSNAFPEAAEKDMTKLIPLMFLIIIVVLGLLLRSAIATFAVVMVILFTVVSALGSFGWLGWILSPATTAIPTIVMTVAIADSVHVLVTFFQAMRRGLNKEDAMRESLHMNLKPVFITSLTTMLGFLSMNFSEVPPFRETGTAVGIGVIAAFIFSVSFLPALILSLPIKVKVQAEKARSDFMLRIAEFIIFNKKIVAGFGIVLSIGLVSAAPLNQLNDSFIEYFDESISFRTDTDIVSEKLTGIYSLGYSLGTLEDGGVSNPNFIKDVHKFVQWAETLEHVQHVYAFTDTYKRLNKNMHEDDESWYRLPEEKDLAAQYLLLYEMSLPYGLDLNDQINVNKSAIRVTLTLDNITSSETIALEKEIYQWIEQNTGIKEVYVGSPNLMFSHLGKRNVTAIISSSMWALVIISLILVAAIRSFKLGAISLVPNLLPAGIAFGLWGIFNGDLGIAITSAVGMTLGIVVDDTVHFLVKYKAARTEKGLSAEDSIRYAFEHVGTALFVTTVVLVSGFLVLASSSFLLNFQQGIFTAMTIAIALILDFTLLPSLLLLLEGKKNVKDSDFESNQLASNS